MHAEDGFFHMLHGFRHSVRRRLGNPQIASRASQALMMGTVDQTGWSIEPVKRGTGQTGHRMSAVLTVPGMEGRCGQILLNCAAEINVQKLHAPADAEYRTIQADECVQQSELRLIQGRIDVERAPVLFSEECRIHIPASGQQQSIEQRYRDGGKAYLCFDARQAKRIFIIFRKIGDTRYQNTHIFSWTYRSEM